MRILPSLFVVLAGRLISCAVSFPPRWAKFASTVIRFPACTVPVSTLRPLSVTLLPALVRENRLCDREASACSATSPLPLTTLPVCESWPPAITAMHAMSAGHGGLYILELTEILPSAFTFPVSVTSPPSMLMVLAWTFATRNEPFGRRGQTGKRDSDFRVTPVPADVLTPSAWTRFAPEIMLTEPVVAITLAR